MNRISRYFFFLTSGNIVWMLGCGVKSSAPSAPVVVPSTYSVVAISDIHFNPLADPSLFPSLVAEDVSQWQSIFQSAQNATPASTVGTDTTYPLLVTTLAAVKQNLGTGPVVLYSGDMLAHDLPEWYCALQHNPPIALASNPPNPCSLDQAGVIAMHSFLDKTVAFVSMQIRAKLGNVPVIFVPGNIDTYSPYGTGPDATFLADNASTYYTQLLNSSVDQASFQSTFTTLGSYSAQLLGSKLRVIALDSNPFAESPYLPPLDPYAELTWLDAQLSAAQSVGQKVWLIMHVPPGANTTGTAQTAAKAGTPAQTTDDEAAMMWEPQYQTEFLNILSKYPGLIAMGVTGHTHMDEFRVLPTGEVMYGIPGISPVFGNNPAFKVFTIAGDTLMPMDYQSISYSLMASPAQFSTLYTFSTAYGATPNTTLESSSQVLYPQLTQTAPETTAFIDYYVSSSVPSRYNMSNTTNWAFFSCGISQMDEQDYVNCVNTY
jgi:sphingomyelin phosphodiesterase acid-like 3